jgi:hypothetical protein
LAGAAGRTTAARTAADAGALAAVVLVVVGAGCAVVVGAGAVVVDAGLVVVAPVVVVAGIVVAVVVVVDAAGVVVVVLDVVVLDVVVLDVVVLVLVVVVSSAAAENTGIAASATTATIVVVRRFLATRGRAADGSSSGVLDGVAVIRRVPRLWPNTDVRTRLERSFDGDAAQRPSGLTTPIWVSSVPVSGAVDTQILGPVARPAIWLLSVPEPRLSTTRSQTATPSASAVRHDVAASRQQRP